MKDWEQARDLVLNWDVLKPSSRLCLNSLDFSDLWEEEDQDAEEDHRRGCDSFSNIPGLPAPPPPPPLPPLPPPPSAPSARSSLKSHTLRLHWRELLSLPALPRATRFGTRSIWAELEPVQVDPDRLQQLFERGGVGMVLYGGCVGGWGGGLVFFWGNGLGGIEDRWWGGGGV
uniref:Uncharacterized protein n=1 Tax=Knipowitschia caucasica TaxID=637954 RepID=A0AAV2KSH6_KNICA